MTDGSASSFAAELARLTPLTDIEVQWPAARLRQRTFIGETAWPGLFVSSARAVVFKAAKVVMVRQTDGHRHIEPGGRLEPGETAETAVRRELLEEIGWSVGALKPLGFHHFQHLGERPADFAYRWGDFVQPLFVAEALTYDRSLRDRTQIEVGSRLTPIRQALAELSAVEAALLNAALARRALP